MRKQYGFLQSTERAKRSFLEDKKDGKINRRKIFAQEAYAWIYRASLSKETDKADENFPFSGPGLSVRAARQMLEFPKEYEVFRMNRQVANEAHLLTGFLRFF